MRIETRLRKLHRIKREIVGLLGIICILMLLVMLAWARDDRKAPVITFQSDVIENYALGDGDEALLKGVTAIDNKDGDISSRLIVYQARLVSKEEISITYQVRDSHGNLTQVTRTCKLSVIPTSPSESTSDTDASTEKTEPSTDAQPTDVSVEDTTEASAEGTTEEPTKETEEPTKETEVSTEETEVSTEETEISTEETEAPTPEPTQKTVTEISVVYVGGVKYAGDTTSPAEFSLNAVYSDGSRADGVTGWGSAEVGKILSAGENVLHFVYEGVTAEYILTAQERPVAGSGIPVLTLNTTEVHVKKGAYFHYRKCIDQLYDDKDPEAVLRDRIRVEGWDKFSTSVPGVYVLKISVLDTDKNRSPVQVLTVYVEE